MNAAFAIVLDKVGTMTVVGYFHRHDAATFGDRDGWLLPYDGNEISHGTTVLGGEFGTAAEYVALPAFGTTATGRKGTEEPMTRRQHGTSAAPSTAAATATIPCA